MSCPLVSIIMASYNHADYIEEAVESVIQQDFNSWELIIVDDASTDQTAEVLELYKNNPKIHIFYSKVNRKIHSRNFAAAEAKGKYLAFLNSDDLFLPEKLKSQVDHLENHPECGVVFSHVGIIDQNSRRLASHSLEKLFAPQNRQRHEWLRYFFEFGNCLCISSAMIDAELFNTIGKFNPLMVQLADLELWTKACFRKEIHVESKMLTCMRITDSNLSHPKPARLSRDFIESQHRVAHYFAEENAEQITQFFLSCWTKQG